MQVLGNKLNARNNNDLLDDKSTSQEFKGSFQRAPKIPVKQSQPEKPRLSPF